MDAKKLQKVAKALNTFMHDDGFMSEVAIKIIWERIMSCITQGHNDEVKLAFPIRMELQNKIEKLLPDKLEVFKKHVQDLDDEMNKMLTCPDLTSSEENEKQANLKDRQKSAKSKRTATEVLEDIEQTAADAIRIRDQLDDKDNQIQTLQEKISQLEEKISKSQKRVKDMSEKFVQTEANQTDHDKEIERLKAKLKGKDEELKRYIADAEGLQNRLSKPSAQTLASGDEDIVDLRNENRPVKLGERYSELYDNEWTDAFEVLTSELHYDDIAAIKKLTEIVHDSYEYCDGLANQQLQGIVERFVYPCKQEIKQEEEIHLDSAWYDTVCDLRRSTGNHSLAHLQAMFIRHMEKNKPDIFNDETLAKVNPYIWKCVELCWHMVIQTPPVYIDTKWQMMPGELFNNDMFKFYSETGDKMDYLVWPTLFLKKDGPVLCKGVAQPRGIL